MKTKLNCTIKGGYRCAKFITALYRSKGYRVLSMVDPETHGVVVQISNTCDGIGGCMKKLIGQKRCAELRIVPCDEGVEMQVGVGEWLAKTVAVAVGTFVFAWPLALIGAHGMIRQKMLLGDVRRNAELFLNNEEARNA